ncbi:hypothetical protein B2J93_938 [Marssonina coronariae]|uniref:Flavodoxin-like domain-containing protein n=1 Tax=Diplocarpon coronariae TaxID=2795749 RepID=A0A218ZDZ1_9HELO|nr:hypothetical protein B2J93_938 [Marssonina coronariae]
MAPKVAIVFYSMYGHIKALAEAEKAGLAKAGIDADIYQVAETLDSEILAKMHAPPKSDYPVIDPAKLATYDAFLLGVPTRFGNFPAQWKAFWDSTGGLWATGGLWGKFAGVFVSSGSPGVIYVPLGFKHSFAQLSNMTEIRGGSPWGAGTFAGADGSRQPSALEIEVATIQGEQFGETLKKVTFGGAAKAQQSAKKESAKVTKAPVPAEETKGKEGPCGLPSKCAIL